MRRIRHFGLLVVGLGLAALLAGCAPDWESELVSVAAGGGQTANRETSDGVLSPDGTKVLFTSYADDLGPPDTNGPTQCDLYLRDLATGDVTLISENAAGTGGGNLGSGNGIFSPDGTKVVFTSWASDLGPADTNGQYDLYLRDLETATTTLVSVNVEGTAAAGNGSSGAGFSGDGTKIVFVGSGDGYIPESTGGTSVFLRDLTTGTTSLVSAAANGGVTFTSSTGAVISPDGSKVAFMSGSDEFGPNDTNRVGDVYVRDLATGTTELVSANRTNTDSGSGTSIDPVFSPDGTKIAFQSPAPDVGPVVAHPGGDNIYLRDLATDTTTLVSVAADPDEDGNGRTCCANFSPDGTKVAFTTYADNLGPVDTNGLQDVYVRDLLAGTTTLVSANGAGTDSGSGRSVDSRFTADGTAIAFESSAGDLGPTDQNALIDVYIRDLDRGETALVSANADASGSANGTSRLVEPMLGRSPLTPAGLLLFRTLATDVGVADTNAQWDVYVAAPKSG